MRAIWNSARGGPLVGEAAGAGAASLAVAVSAVPVSPLPVAAASVLDTSSDEDADAVAAAAAASDVFGASDAAATMTTRTGGRRLAPRRCGAGPVRIGDILCIALGPRLPPLASMPTQSCARARAPRRIRGASTVAVCCGGDNGEDTAIAIGSDGGMSSAALVALLALPNY